jgi:hypothetical protein
MRLVYELHLTNFSTSAVHLERIDVRDADRRALLTTFVEMQLAGLLTHPGRPVTPSDRLVIEPGTLAVCYFWLTLDKGAAVPRTLVHQVDFKLLDSAAGTSLVTEGAVVRVSRIPPMVLTPPLRGGPWVAVYDPAMDRGHRRMIFAVNGTAQIPARFAIDWFKVDADGKLAHGDSSATTNWYGYGADVLAVARAVVHAVRDDVPESASVATTGRPANALQNASGNFVSLDLGAGRYAFYEHLKPGSIRVLVGDHVVPGEVIASLGYTGDSTGPHLHFHLADGSSPLAAEGVPYVIGAFNVLGGYSSIEAFASERPWTPVEGWSTRRSQEFPTANAVVEFP